MSVFAIREANEADVPLILALIRELADFEDLLHEVVATEDGLRETLFGEQPGAEVIFAQVDNTTAGFALFFPNYSTFLGQRGIYLEDLYVRPEFRGRGIGRGLLAHLAKLAVDRKCGRLTWAVLDWNEPAIRFYQALGAKPMDDWTVYRLDKDALVKLAGESR